MGRWKGILAAVDCSTQEKLCQQLIGPEDVPSFILYKNGKAQYKFPGQTTKKNFISFLISHKQNLRKTWSSPKINKPSVLMPNVEKHLIVLGQEAGAQNFDDVIHKHKNVFVAFLSHRDPNRVQVLKSLYQVKKKLGDSKGLIAVIDCSLNLELCKYFGIFKVPSFRYFKYSVPHVGFKNHMDVFKYEGLWTAQAILKFLRHPVFNKQESKSHRTKSHPTPPEILQKNENSSTTTKNQKEISQEISQEKANSNNITGKTQNTTLESSMSPEVIKKNTTNNQEKKSFNTITRETQDTKSSLPPEAVKTKSHPTPPEILQKNENSSTTTK